MARRSLRSLSFGVGNVDLSVDAEFTFWKTHYAKHTGFRSTHTYSIGNFPPLLLHHKKRSFPLKNTCDNGSREFA